MRLLVFTTLIFIVFTIQGYCSGYGTVRLKNGKSMEGRIEELKSGACTVTNDFAIVKFEKKEIKTIVYKVKFKPVKRAAGSQIKVIQNKIINDESYDGLIHSAAKKHGIDPSLVKAVMKAESNFNPKDKSNKGACGLMQLMPATARILGVKDIYSPYENVYAGTKFLKNMLWEFDGDLELALAAYNAGPGAVKRYGNVPPYKETRNYIKKVYKNYNRYNRCDGIFTYTDEKGCLNIYNVR